MRPAWLPWFGPPPGTLPAAVPLDLVLAKTDEVAVCISSLAVYPTVMQFEVITLIRDEDAVRRFDPDPFLMSSRGLRGDADDKPPARLLRIGLEFADGSAVSSADSPHHGSERPSVPVMRPTRGGGGRAGFQYVFWVWPLPPEGPMVWTCQWPAHDIATRCEVAAQPVLDAAKRARVLFSYPPGFGLSADD